MILEELATCPACNATRFIPQLSTTDYTQSGESFQIKACDNCGLLATTPRPTESSIGKYYQLSTYISHNTSSSSFTDTVYKLIRTYTIRQKARLVESFQSQGKLLDIGAGTGTFAKELARRNWEVATIEPNDKARKTIQQAGITTFANLTDYNTEANAITMWHVLEHTHHPDETLAIIKSKLADKGHLFIAVPNPESPDAKHYAQHWAAYDVPRHLFHFKKKNMAQLLKNAGFELLQIKPMYFDAYYVSLLSEKYRQPTKPTLTHLTNSFIQGYLSNYRARPNNHSSVIYIAKHV